MLRIPETLSQDFLASIVVFLVALPLCLGVAVASGAPPALGIVTGIIGGIVVGSIAGSPLQVSGPAAGLVVLVSEAIQTHGLAMLGVIGLLAGATQFVAGLLRLGQWFRAMSPSVIHGMLAGIGVLIFASQFHVMIDDKPRGGGIANLLAIPEAVGKAIFPMDASTHHLAALVGIATILTIIVWDRVKPAVLKSVPAALVAVIVGTALAKFLNLPITRVDVPASLATSLNMPTLQGLQHAFDPAIIGLALVFAFVASAETLLCATAVDQMHTGPRTRYDKELRAQGIGNILCGAVGALPMTGVIVRSSANVQSGAKTRLSAMLHGVWLLATVAALPWLLNEIPTAALAAILVYTGYKLVNIARIKAIAEYGRTEIAIYAATLAGIIFVDLLTGVVIGFGLATAKLVYTFTHIHIDKRQRPGGDPASPVIDIDLHGAATFFSIPRLASALESVPSAAEIHVHIEHLSHIDHACLEMVEGWARQHEATGGTVTLEWRELERRYTAPRPTGSTRVAALQED
ncbi:MAG: SulP family inorganic anion transporter [Sphingomonas sp.]